MRNFFSRKLELEITMDVGKSIKAARLERNMTQLKLSKMAELSRNYLALVESGSRKPSLDAISKLAKALEMEAHELLADDRLLKDIRERVLAKFGGLDQIEEILSEIKSL